MKRYLLFCQLALLFSFHANAQFSSGNNGFYVAAGTDVNIDGLTFKPSTAFTIANNTLTISPTAYSGSPPGISRVYTFTAPLTFAGRLGLFYKATELNGNTESGLQVAYKNISPTVTTTSIVNTSTHYVYNDLSSPATFSTVSATQVGALPVTLIDFNVKKEGSAASITWSTSAETNSAYFEVQHSIDAIKWTGLSKIDAAFQSNTIKNYRFTHDNPATGSNFYRLKMVDIDQTYAYSRIRELEFDQAFDAILYPNPVLEKLSIKVADWSEVASIKLFNEQGRSLFESAGKVISSEINMRSYPPGLYLVQLKRKNGSMDVLKVVKQ